jgi:DNA polymerase V
MSVTVLGRSERLRHLLPEAEKLRISGFRSAAGEWEENATSLDRLVGSSELPIWVVMVDDESLLDFGIYPGDRLIIDRAADIQPGSLLVMDVNGHYEVRRLQEDRWGNRMLAGGTQRTHSLCCCDEEPLDLVGVVTFVLSYVAQPRSCA